MYRTSVTKTSILAIVLAIGVMACDNGTPTNPVSPQAQITTSSTQYLSCPVADWQVGWGLVLPRRGGTIAVEAGSITVPDGAVDRPTFIMVFAPKGPHTVLDIRANGREHFQFEKPVEITFDYARCMDRASGATLEGWEVDSYTHAPIAEVDGTNYPDAAEYTITTDHLTSYTLIVN